MQKNLVIVESPAKAKTIGNFLGPDFEVKSSMGHIRDLKKKGLGVDVNDNFKPDYEISPDKKKLVSELKSLAKSAEVVWLASDEDREGESIAWHLYNVLGLKPENSHRIVFHEITKTAIQNAVANPREIDINLVDAQQARRVLDRLVGFEISPILWRKIKPSLSAGRVQSVTVRLIVDREEEIKNFNPVDYYKVTARFIVKDADGKQYKLDTLLNAQLKNEAEVKTFLQHCQSSTYKIGDIQAKTANRYPAAPFTTSTLQQEAVHKLGFSVSKTMLIAQNLYEAGKITYMRTDSVNLSTLALGACKEEITKMAGEDYLNIHEYTTKSKGAQEAHEAIRPTYISKHTVEGSSDEKKLYDLIWKRTIASQMKPAVIENTTVSIDISADPNKFTATGEIVKFDGFLKVYRESVDDEDDSEVAGILPPITVGQQLDEPEVVDALERLTRAPYRYTEASLVKKLEEKGIGRPSTYAPTISTVISREYVEKADVAGVSKDFKNFTLKNGKVEETVKQEMYGSEHAKLVPTDLGTVVNSFLVSSFPNIMDYDFTANEEKNLDDVAEGNLNWTKMMSDFYKAFHPTVEQVEQQQGPKVGERLLGTDPTSGKPVYVKIGRFGPVVQIGTADDEEKPRFASLKKNMHLDTVTLEEVMELFKLPRIVGEYEGKEMKVAEGRFGPYVQHDGKFFSLKKNVDDPMTITAERAIELIEEKREAERNRVIMKFEDADIEVCNGRFGPYIAHAGANYKIPKTTDAKTLTLEDCQKLIAEQGDKKPARRTRTTAAKSTTAAKTSTKTTTKKSTAKSK